MEEKLIDHLKNDKGKKYLLILHDNPDPDAIGSSLGFGIICDHFKISYDIVYAGKIHRTENRALVTKLNLENRLNEFKEFNKKLEDYDRYAFIDCINSGSNVSIQIKTMPDIVFYNHDLEEKIEASVYSSIGSGFGCISSRIALLIKKLELRMDKPVVLALAYGIRADTRKLLSVSAYDLDAYTYLMGHTGIDEQRMLEEIENPYLTDNFFKLMSSGNDKCKKIGTYQIVPLGLLEEADIETVGTLIEIFKQRHGSDVTIVWGHYITKEISKDVSSCSVVSLRNKNDAISAVRFMANVFGKEHSGGDKLSAGGRVPIPFRMVQEDEALNSLDKEYIARIENEIAKIGDKTTA